MKEYKYKFLTEALQKEIDDLWDNGHSEALTAFGYECVNAYKDGLNKSLMPFILIGAGLGVTWSVAEHLIKKKLKQKRNFKVIKYCP